MICCQRYDGWMFERYVYELEMAAGLRWQVNTRVQRATDLIQGEEVYYACQDSKPY
jgi:hypothetical protein